VKVVLLGMNHRTAPVDVRELFAGGETQPLLRKLIDRPEIAEAALISTCNRVELVVTTDKPDAARHVLYEFFSRELAGGSGPSAAALEDMTYLYKERDAVEHVFRVASSIDSMVVGEPQILGQVKDAYREAAEAGVCGAVLSRLFQRAFATAKRVKNETGIAQRPVSVARVAVDLAKQIFETLDDKSALLIGAGEMVEASLVALHDHGLGARRIANRTPAHAESLARRFAGTAHGLDEIDSPTGKLQRFLENYRDRYLKDRENFPGGCIFVTFSVELDDQRPHLCKEVNKGFVGVKGMLNRLLDEGKAAGELRDEVDTSAITEMLFAGMLGASVIYGVGKSPESLDHSTNALIDYLEQLKNKDKPG